MTKLVQYVGEADVRIVASEDFAKAGISSPTLTFSHQQETDFYASVSDAKAIFLLAQGDFRAYNGESILDILQHISSPEAQGEVTSVTIGGGSPQTGAVTLPVDEANLTPSLRTLGTQAGQSLPGNDPVRTQALRTTLFGASNRGNRVVISDSSGAAATVQLSENDVLIGGSSGIVSMPLSEFITLVETGDAGITLSAVTDLDSASSQATYVLTDLGAGNTPRFGFRPVPLVGTPPSGGGSVRFGSVVVPEDGVSGNFDLTAEPWAHTYVIDRDEQEYLNLLLPSPVSASSFILNIVNLDELLGASWEVPEIERWGDIQLPAGSVDRAVYLAYPQSEETAVEWVFHPLPSFGSSGVAAEIIDLTSESPGTIEADLTALPTSADLVVVLLPNGGASTVVLSLPSYLDEHSGFDVVATSSANEDVTIEFGGESFPQVRQGVAAVRVVHGLSFAGWTVWGGGSGPSGGGGGGAIGTHLVNLSSQPIVDPIEVDLSDLDPEVASISIVAPTATGSSSITLTLPTASERGFLGFYLQNTQLVNLSVTNGSQLSGAYPNGQLNSFMLQPRSNGSSVSWVPVSDRLLALYMANLTQALQSLSPSGSLNLDGNGGVIEVSGRVFRVLVDVDVTAIMILDLLWEVVLVLIQGVTGGALTLDVGEEPIWISGSAPTLSTIEGEADIIRLTRVQTGTSASSFVAEVVAQGVEVPAPPP